ncbi:MAG: FUSC family protein, partial [Nitrosopumilus sp.]|nr:FUSC family protein [Nitrosopumilus sp.]
ITLGVSINSLKQLYFFEAIKITLFCLSITGIYWLLGLNQSTLLIMFNLAVMASVATFSPEKKKLSLIAEGVVLILFSIIAGAWMGFYSPIIASICSVLYALLAFWLPRSSVQRNLFVTGAVMFFIFTALPFDTRESLMVAFYGALMLPAMLLFYGLVDPYIYSKESLFTNTYGPRQKKTAYIAGLALSSAWVVSVLLIHYTTITHIYWIGLTTLVVIQGAQGKTMKTAVNRIVINTCGALIIVLLTNYVIITNFQLNFILLVGFLFGIFALGYSYTWRTLFVELFVLSFTNLLGQYQPIIALDRILLTVIGGLIVMASTLIIHLIPLKLPKKM